MSLFFLFCAKGKFKADELFQAIQIDIVTINLCKLCKEKREKGEKLE